MKYFLTFLGVFLSISIYSQKLPQSKFSTKILLIPLDDRPPCLQFTKKMGLIGNTEVIVPPKEFLGNFNIPGESDKIIDWLKKQDLKSCNAAIISLDMLAYGGLVASRIHNVSDNEALRRIEVIKTIRKIAPHLLIYAQSVIMRLSPTGDGKNEAYRGMLAEWAEISAATDEKSKIRTNELENQIPAKALLDYKLSRKRNFSVNLKAIDFVKDDLIDYLILSQDDAKPNGVHITEREELIAKVKRLKLTKKILIQPGADEISMLLLARSLNKYYDVSPRIKIFYSSEVLSDKPMPFEDRPLRQTVGYDIEAVGGKEVDDSRQADLFFYVYPSRFEVGEAKSFADEIENKVNSGGHVLVADIDPRGDVQGGDSSFTMELLHRKLFPKLFSYASWNTAGNTIGTTLPQGVIFALGESKIFSSKRSIKNRIRLAEDWFTFHRVIDDYYYHTVVRAQARIFIIKKHWDPNHLSNDATKEVEDYCTILLQNHFKELKVNYSSVKDGNENGFNPEKMTFILPWHRTFEAEINFETKGKK